MAADTHLFVLVTRLVTMLVTTFVQCSFADNQSGSGYGVLKFSSIKNVLSSKRFFLESHERNKVTLSCIGGCFVLVNEE